nr:hypothetical protein [Tanacetum cinerariifolium]
MMRNNKRLMVQMKELVLYHGFSIDEIPGLNLTNVDQTEYEEEDVDEGVQTTSDDEFTHEEKLNDKEIMDGEEDDEVLKELYEDVNVNLEKVTLPEIPNFASVFKFDQRVSALESKLSKLKQTNQFTEVVSLISGIVDKYLASKMKEAVNRRKSGKDVESSKDLRSNENNSSSTSKDASQSQHKSSSKSVHAEEPSHTVEESGMQQDQEFVTRDNDEQPVDKEVTKAD